MEEDTLASECFELGQIRQLADGSVNRDRISLGEAERPCTIGRLVIGWARFKKRANSRRDHLQLELFVFDYSTDRKRDADHLLPFLS